MNIVLNIWLTKNTESTIPKTGDKPTDLSERFASFHSHISTLVLMVFISILVLKSLN